MKSLFDTSVLLTAFLEDHEHHAASLRVFLAVDRRRGCCAAHSLAEVYASFTRLPVRHRLTGKMAALIVGEIRDRLSMVSLDADEYYTLITEAAASGIIGGTIYDALLGAPCPESGGRHDLHLELETLPAMRPRSG